MKPHKISTHSAHSDNFYLHIVWLSDWVEILWGFMKLFAVGAGSWLVGAKIHAARTVRKMKTKHMKDQKNLYSQYYNDDYKLCTMLVTCSVHCWSQGPYNADPKLGRLLSDYLIAKGFDTTWAKDGVEGLKHSERSMYSSCECAQLIKYVLVLCCFEGAFVWRR